ncbi:MAG: hypothetical protein GKS02_07665 [Alphaproteobacteria bacterium]|nr:hypothetical protein [Alphaproteobacteria bacterium]
MGILIDYQRAALALIAVGVVALYAGVFAFPSDSPHTPEAEWVALPDVSPIARATLPAVGTPDFDELLPSEKRSTVTVAALHDKFSAVSFDMAAVRQGNQTVPRLFAEDLPHDLRALSEVAKLKQTYFKMVLPLALKVNEEILADRHRLLLLQKARSAGEKPSTEQREWLAELAARYDTEPDDVAELLRRIDAISPALAIAQSAEESGWGRSRFALTGNALFGQRTWDQGLGIVPRQREDGLRFEVRAFPSLLDSVRSYAQNLNGHPAYDDFRTRRAEMRAGAGVLDPYALIETLTAYSERREHYIETIQKILRVDRLEELEGTKLADQSIETTQFLSAP